VTAPGTPVSAVGSPKSDGGVVSPPRTPSAAVGSPTGIDSVFTPPPATPAGVLSSQGEEQESAPSIKSPASQSAQILNYNFTFSPADFRKAYERQPSKVEALCALKGVPFSADLNECLSKLFVVLSRERKEKVDSSRSLLAVASPKQATAAKPYHELSVEALRNSCYSAVAARVATLGEALLRFRPPVELGRVDSSPTRSRQEIDAASDSWAWRA